MDEDILNYESKNASTNPSPRKPEMTATETIKSE